ncbi:RNI-like protein, partial [Morchella conica CCBAS932]
LPPELKLHILRHLSTPDLLRTAATSRDFHTLTRDGQLWSTLDTTTYYTRIPAAQLASLITTAGPFIRHLNLRGCHQLAADWRQDAAYYVPHNLHTAVLEGAQPSKAALGYIVHHNTNLVRLDIAGCRALTYSVARLIAQSLPALQAADISWCTGLEPRGLRRIVEGCTALRELRACGVNGFDDTAVMAAIHAANRLTTLNMNSCAALSDDAIRTLCLGPYHHHGSGGAGAPPPPRKLVRLSVSACPRLTDAALHVLAAHAPHLEGFEAAGNTGLTDAGLVALFGGAKALSHVDLEGCVSVSDASLTALSRAGRVVYLNVGGCGEVGDVGVVDVLRRCGGVRGVEVDGTAVTDRVLDEAVRAVRYRGVGEVAVAVYDCAGVTWEGVRGVMAQNWGGGGGRVKVKCYFGWQAVVDTHWERCGRGEVAEAEKVERAWAVFMGGGEEGGRRRRRR